MLRVPLFLSSIRKFSKTDAFWTSIKQRKEEKGKYSPLDSISVNLAQNHPFKYANKPFLTVEEFFDSIDSITETYLAPFLVVDAREDEELQFFPFKSKNKQSIIIPYIHRPIAEIIRDNIYDFPKDKVLILIDSIGLKSRRASGTLYQEGYLTTYLEGGYDQYRKYLKEHKINI